jgi:serine-type D-Ala-D-Ala carboxypeptidase (penicillin-binding protein 5/6)
MMTAYTVIDLAKQFKIKLNELKIKVCSIASNIRGTTAELKQGDVYTAEQLLYGMMLPSGNDAAFALAKKFGKLLFERKGYTEKDMERIRSF